MIRKSSKCIWVADAGSRKGQSVLRRGDRPAAGLHYSGCWGSDLLAGTQRRWQDIDAASDRWGASDLGREFFSSSGKAFPEISFQWKVGSLVLHGAIDRLVQLRNGSWVVVDYKSSIQEQSLEDYRFQVASYMAAVREHAVGSGDPAPHVSGYLVDLFSATALLVESEHDDAMRQLRQEIKNTAGNYTPADTKPNLLDGFVKGGVPCFSCPYSFHCEIGKGIVLAFS